LAKDIGWALKTSPEHDTHSTFYYTEAKKGDDGENPAEPNRDPAGAEPNELPTLPFESGDILYSANVIALNSDVPSPVVAQIAAGAYKGTTFFGTFKRHEKYLLSRFDRLKTPGGDEYPVNAIALDMDTGSAAVRSSVDSHYLERWALQSVGRYRTPFNSH
jgi:hypothetical protein